MTGDLFQLTGDVLIGAHLFARRRRDLHKAGLAAIRAALQIGGEALEAVRQPLGIIQPVHPDQEGFRRLLAKGLFVLLRLKREALGVDADGEGPDRGDAVQKLDAAVIHEFRPGIGAIHLKAAGHIGAGLQADQIVAGQIGGEFLGLRQHRQIPQ